MTRTAGGLSIYIPGTAATKIEKTPFYKEPGSAEAQEHTPIEQDHAGESEESHLKIFCHACQQKLDVSSLSPFARFNCPVCNAELIVPKWFDNYLLEEPAGAGGMATVYRALDLALDREVAIKILNPEVASEKERSELFLHEARTAATINHYAIIPIYTCGISDNQPYIVMQYLGGGTLELKIKLERKGLPVKQTAKWIRDIADGLDNAKRHGIIHHDIKPGNIMLDSDDNAKIGDFGIAQAVNDARTTKIFELTKSWISPHYVSPEKVIEGKEDHRGDIYSLGATFYHLITGYTPFNDDDATELIRMRVRKDPAPPIQYNPDIPQEISDLIISMMSRDPDKRPAYRDIVKSLNTFLKKGKTGKHTAATATQQHRQTTPRSIPLPASTQNGNPFFKVAFVIIIAVLTGAAVWWISSGKLKDTAGGDKTDNEATAPKEPETLDFLPEASALFAQGNSEAAKEKAELVFNNPNSIPEARKQAALMLAISAYLNMAAQPKDECSFIIERLGTLNIPETDPDITILRFLERYEIQPEALFSRLESDSKKKAIGTFAAFLRSLYNKENITDTIKYFSQFSSASPGFPDGYWGKAWQERLKEWQYCLSAGKRSPTAKMLEPIIAGRLTSRPVTPAATKTSQQTDISVISPAWFAQHRAFAAGRPQLSEYRVGQQQLEQYISALPGDKKNSERQKATFLSQLRESVVSSLSKIPFPTELKLTDGNTVSGRMIFFQNSITICSENGSSRKLSWNELSLNEYINIVLYYIALREEAVSSNMLPEADMKNTCADLYFKLAVLCDWAKDYNRACEFIKKSQNMNKSIDNEIRKYILN